MIHQVHVTDVDLAVFFQSTQRNVSLIHKSEENSFQHSDGIVSDAPQSMFGDLFQILLKIHTSNEFVESENRIADIQAVGNKHWQNALIYSRICGSSRIVHCTIILPLKRGVPLRNSSFSLGLIISQPLFYFFFYLYPRHILKQGHCLSLAGQRFVMSDAAAVFKEAKQRIFRHPPCSGSVQSVL